MRRVEVELRKVGTLVTGVTKFDQGKNRGIFGDLLDQVSDYSQTVIGSKKISVDYELWIPEDIDLTIENKFGDIYLASLTGPVSIDLSHGDLRANKVSNKLSLKS